MRIYVVLSVIRDDGYGTRLCHGLAVAQTQLVTAVTLRWPVRSVRSDRRFGSSSGEGGREPPLSL